MVLFSRQCNYGTIGRVRKMDVVDIWVVNVDGTFPTYPGSLSSPGNVSQGYDYTAKSMKAVWSPDSQMIAYQNSFYGEPNIYVVNWDGSNNRAVAYSSDHETDPAWSTDGEWIIYEREWDRHSTRGFWRLDPDGYANEFCGDTREQCGP